MNPHSSTVSLLQDKSIIESFKGIQRGLEKECLRIETNGTLSLSPHPKSLGSNLTHPFITTDYSSALLELITPPLSSVESMFEILDDLHRFSYAALNSGIQPTRHLPFSNHESKSKIKDELLWAGSMPCRLPEEARIPVAEYGNSNLGRLKTIYRYGLGHRYGRRMQMIAGIHYNFSLPKAFWEQYAYFKHYQGSLKTFISENYLGLIRNAFRFSWILPYLFGASPALHADFIPAEQRQELQNSGKIQLQNVSSHTLLFPEATSLRLSDLGYHNQIKPLIEISYDSYADFLKTMQAAVHTPDPIFTRIGVKRGDEYLQLSDCVLQVEDEHYALFRPKRVAPGEERMLKALVDKGIEYVEIRALDINPFLSLGIQAETVYILDAFLIWCLLLESPALKREEKSIMASNQARVVQEGRKPNLMLMDFDAKPRLLKGWAREIMTSLKPIAQALDAANKQSHFSQAIVTALAWIESPETLPSARVVQEMQTRSESYCEFGLRWSKMHEKLFKESPLPEQKMIYYKNLAEGAWLQQQALEHSDKMNFDQFLTQFLNAC